MRQRFLSLFGAVCVFALLLSAQTSDPALQGKWTVIGAQHGGKPMDGLTGGVMTVANDRFEIRTASGSTLKGALQVNTSVKPYVMGFLHDSGMRWDAIYEVDGEDFKLNYVDTGGKDPRPTAFKTSAATEETLVILKRAK